MKSQHVPGIFNDVMGPIMRGPSSSHTAAAHRIGSMIKQIRKPDYSGVTVKFDKTGALATTYLGQGSAMGLAGGLLGLEITDHEIINYEKQVEERDLTIDYIITNIENKHPNAYQISVEYPDGEELQILAISTGGGMFDIVKWDGFEVSLKGDFYETILILNNGNVDIEEVINAHFSDIIIYKSLKTENNLLLNVKSGANISAEIDELLTPFSSTYLKFDLVPVMPAPSATKIELPFTTVDEMLQLASAENLSLSELAINYENARTGLSAEAILKKMEEIVLITKEGINAGLKGTVYEDRILGAQSPLIEKAEKEGRIPKTINSSIIAYTSALMEVKSSMGVIVAAPTAGSCGTIGGALFGSLNEKEFDLREMTKAFLAAGLIGVFIAWKYTFAAEEGGCQVETGSSAAMAAAGLVELNGGTAKQAVDAASMALQNQLGLICDPVAVRVEVPCLGKNIMAASNAYNSFIMAISGFDAVIPYSEVIDTMKTVGETLPSSLCCTGLGGLAQTETGKCLNQKFNF
ncbi:MAG: L-serine ammonia-lyase, iron-sulfur-dependent, subunit alpha [Melioribacteraceae bacterium]|nr:L-serine ammonia-lyase, iron-sulfur-dependent, subunit alpha [Melioribacteraceae bacterium]